MHFIQTTIKNFYDAISSLGLVLVELIYALPRIREPNIQSC
jgi:hypothetical protein